jgi:hypothetical protein
MGAIIFCLVLIALWIVLEVISNNPGGPGCE